MHLSRRTSAHRFLKNASRLEIGAALCFLAALYSGFFLWHANHQLMVQNRTLAAQITPAVSPPSGKVAPVTAADHILGKANAPITLIEYSDFECPYCKDFEPNIEKVVADLPDQVRLVYRQFPLDIHANAMKEAEASECVAAQGGDAKFWAFHDALFTRTTSNGTGFSLNNLAPLAKEVGVDEAMVAECLSSGKQAAKVKADIASGTEAGVTGTPTTILLKADGTSKLVLGVVKDGWLEGEIKEFAR